MNPYWGCNFFEFLYQFIIRMPKILIGKESIMQDELQVLVLCAMSISCAMLGVILVLRKITMLANSISHTSLLGIVIVFLFFSNAESSSQLSLSGYLLASFISAVITTLISDVLTKFLKVQEDASIALVFTFLFAFGIVLITFFSPNAHIGTEIVMGNVDVLMMKDLKLLATIAFFNICILKLCYKEYLLTSFDMQFAKLIKMPTNLFNYLLMFQLSATVIGSFRVVGVILVLSYIVGPYLISSLFIKDYKRLLFVAPLVGCFLSLFGVALSRHFLSVNQMALSTGGICVSLMAFAYFCCLIFKDVKKRAIYAN
jgi:manganese/zinc/iron transport system permease protein